MLLVLLLFLHTKFHIRSKILLVISLKIHFVVSPKMFQYMLFFKSALTVLPVIELPEINREVNSD